MMSGLRDRRRSLGRHRRRLEQDIIDNEWDYPVALEREGFTVWRLGRREEHLFLADLTTPITVTAVSTTYRYQLAFDLTLSKLVLYQRDAALAETDDGINLRINLLHPNGVPEILYGKQGVSWPYGGERITGLTYMPASELQVVVDGTATNLLYLSFEVEVHNIA